MTIVRAQSLISEASPHLHLTCAVPPSPRRRALFTINLLHFHSHCHLRLPTPPPQMAPPSPSGSSNFANLPQHIPEPHLLWSTFYPRRRMSGGGSIGGCLCGVG
ncbi:hypothetical protein Droror1_Dr00019634 [Drosera rotundifolia]